jgi:cobalt-zinc-cadmium efflux system membrane fusion protein
MQLGKWHGGFAVALLAASGLVVGGCAKDDNKGGEAKPKAVKAQQMQVAETKHDHGSWWCDEHGVPEEVCARCNARVAAEFKKKGDWCKEHDRPDSQCFLCHPELRQKFAARYRARYGTEPPPTEEEEKKDGGVTGKPDQGSPAGTSPTQDEGKGKKDDKAKGQ